MQGPLHEPPPAHWRAWLDAADARALAWIASRRRNGLVAFMRAVTHTGDASSLTVALFLALVVSRGRAAALATVATTLALAVSTAAKRLCARTRPQVFALLEAPDRFSMPSGHAACAWALATALAAVVPPLAGALVLAWALLVSLSRVVLAVHYPLDVLVGSAMGIAAGAAVIAFT